jgi:hypothetical protein
MCDDQYNFLSQQLSSKSQEALFPESAKNVRCMLERLDADGFADFDG